MTVLSNFDNTSSAFSIFLVYSKEIFNTFQGHESNKSIVGQCILLSVIWQSKQPGAIVCIGEFCLCVLRLVFSAVCVVISLTVFLAWSFMPCKLSYALQYQDCLSWSGFITGSSCPVVSCWERHSRVVLLTVWTFLVMQQLCNIFLFFSTDSWLVNCTQC